MEISEMVQESICSNNVSTLMDQWEAMNNFLQPPAKLKREEFDSDCDDKHWTGSILFVAGRVGLGVGRRRLDGAETDAWAHSREHQWGAAPLLFLR